MDASTARRFILPSMPAQVLTDASAAAAAPELRHLLGMKTTAAHLCNLWNARNVPLKKFSR